MSPKNKFIVIGTPGNLQIQDVPYPVLPSDDYMIVKVRAVAVQPTDPFHADIQGEHSVQGCYAGCDYAGEVVEVGKGVTKDFKNGDRVAGFGNGG